VPVLPMFPLGAVLLPGEMLPLHVFEPRYRALVDDCFATPDGPRFGVVLIARGHEVGGGDERHDIGTVARIVRREMTPDGRSGLLCAGEERIRVRQWLPDDPYPRADVEELDDEPVDLAAFDAALPAVLDASAATHDLLVRVATLTGRERPPFPALVTALRGGDTADLDHTTISYALASSGPLGAADRLRVLAAPDAAARLRAVAEALDDANAALAFRLGPEAG
jgi:ATP-dependent Lon protease